MRKYTKNRELARSSITRFASNFITLKFLMTSREELRRMIVGEFVSSSYAKTTAGIDVGNILFDEDGFWAPTQEIIKIIFLQLNI